MKFSTLHLSKLFSKRSEATNPRAGRRHNDNCTPEQTRAFDASYHEVKEISITLYAHLAGCSVGPFPDLDIDHGQVMKFFGHVGAEEGERGFGLTQLGLWRAMRTGQQPAEASLIVREKMFIGKEFLVAGGVRSIMWQEESLWYDLCFETKGFYSHYAPHFKNSRLTQVFRVLYSQSSH